MSSPSQRNGQGLSGSRKVFGHCLPSASQAPGGWLPPTLWVEQGKGETGHPSHPTLSTPPHRSRWPTQSPLPGGVRRAISVQLTDNWFSLVQSLSCVWLFATPWTAARQASLSITNSRNLLKLIPIESVMPSNHLILCHPLLLLPSIFPSIRVFLNESISCIRWPKYWSFSLSICLSNEYSKFISFIIDWFDLLAVKSLLQHHNSKASILRKNHSFDYMDLCWQSDIFAF